MRRRALAAILGVNIVVCWGLPANGCGDKLLVLGRGIRLEALLGNRPAKILAYQHSGTRGAELIADPEFQSALKSAGYQFRVVRDIEELEVALRLGKYDLVVADVADASAVAPPIRSVAGAPALVPPRCPSRSARATPWAASADEFSTGESYARTNFKAIPFAWSA